MVISCYGLLFQKYDRLAKPSRFLHLRRFLKFPGVRDLRLSRAQLGAEAEDECSKLRGTSGCGLRRITCKRVYQNSIETQEQIGAFRFTADFKGLWVAVEEGVVFHAAGCGVGSGPRPREWRKLFYSEDPWQAHRRVPAKKCDVRCGRKFRSARWHTTSKPSANM